MARLGRAQIGKSSKWSNPSQCGQIMWGIIALKSDLHKSPACRFMSSFHLQHKLVPFGLLSAICLSSYINNKVKLRQREFNVDTRFATANDTPPE